MKGYTVFNVEQIDGLPEPFYAKAEPRGDTVQRIANETASLPRPAQTCAAEPAQCQIAWNCDPTFASNSDPSERTDLST